MIKTLVLLAMISANPVLTQAQSFQFQHIVIIYQENRTPDNLFQGLCGTTRSLCPSPYDPQNFGTDNQGQTIQLRQVPLGGSHDPDHSHGSFVKLCDLDPTTISARWMA